VADDQEIRRQITDAIIAAEVKMEFSVCLHPTNTEEQKEKFLAEEIEEPIFTYKKSQLTPVSFPDFVVHSEIDALYRDRMGHTKGLALLLQLVEQDREFSALSQVLFPVKEIGNMPPEKEESAEEPSIDAKEIVSAFREALDTCEVQGWTVEVVDECSSRMFVNQWAKKVAVRADVHVTKEELAALTRHEIGVHVLRAAHGARQEEPLLSVGTLHGRLVEEGVACSIENTKAHRRIYERHLAVETALTHSFRETWQELCKSGCDADEAWTHTLRVKRGLTDGASRGAFTRDAVYAQGYEEIQQFVAGNGDMASLLSAPIHPDEIELLTKEANMQTFPLPVLLKQ
jgi:hypothetical protein